MKTPLLVLLVLSLAANAALVVQHLRTPARAPADGVVALAAPEATPAGTTGWVGRAGLAPAGNAVGAAAAPAWRPPRNDADLRALAASLRAAGYPASVVRAMVGASLSQRLNARRPDADLPFWKQAAADPKIVAARNALERERREALEQILGPDGRPSAMLDEVARARQYGNLPDDKVDALAAIERDYREVSVEDWARRRGNVLTDNASRLRSQQLMEEELLADVSALLSPEEAAHYEMRNSNAARRLMNDLRAVDVSEEEYAALFQLRKAFDQAHPRPPSGFGPEYFQQQVAQLEAHAQARSLLGDERFFQVLETSDYNYANITKSLAAFPTVKPADAFQVLQLQLELQSALVDRPGAARMDPKKVEELRQTINTRLEAVLGVEAAAAYRRQGNGRLFNVSRPTPPPGG